VACSVCSFLRFSGFQVFSHKRILSRLIAFTNTKNGTKYSNNPNYAHALDYHYLLHFLAVSKEVNLPRAREVLDVPQASISAQLKRFEEPLEGALGTPTTRRLILSNVSIRRSRRGSGTRVSLAASCFRAHLAPYAPNRLQRFV
jgi:hypothetical protein